ncbi:pro-sigmaK processing inhibitor BofA family protein [Caloramator proteoclasticus]|uniref:Inhibitor of the pro-sigma K processing machinery n=1 Tax=Caloramator proteoclasticus DSM 10124 TaxID=1121262 RepID=A0A1M5AWV8_9CLOT|nr:pro-sigmaK processing inhibitor BofA family protein [Caloramator proteoclasticus]SHF34699.1 inhibitor of the pro-sigma K processing machinery [Caloramator proteoclasticus DSM 10124]
MPLQIDINVIVFVLVILLLFLFVMALKEKSLIVIKFILKTAIGALIIFAANIIGQKFNITIPLNIFTAFCAGVLGIPGIGLIVLLEWTIF